MKNITSTSSHLDPVQGLNDFKEVWNVQICSGIFLRSIATTEIFS